MKLASVLSLTACCAVLSAGAQSPDQQLSFARQLEADGDAAFALLEYKRFVYHHPSHAKAAEARMNTANIYLFYLADLGQARTLFARAIETPGG